MLAVAVDFAGSGVDVSAAFMVEFFGFCVLLVAMAMFFNRSVNHTGWYVDEHWGDGSIDDDDWGLSIAEARKSTSRALKELADRDEARVTASRPTP
ncbi:MAG: hypothetical protein JWP02_3520 [Acidimicrobiales bacterium]|nr:hypothetical protein [Acidimicrobiales bacterium]